MQDHSTLGDAADALRAQLVERQRLAGEQRRPIAAATAAKGGPRGLGSRPAPARRRGIGGLLGHMLALLLVGSLLALAAPVRPAQAQIAGLVVNSTSDPGNGICDAGECTLREAIAAAQPGATISFSLPTSSMIALTAGELVVARGVRIQGPGTAALLINAGQASRAIRVEGGNGAVSITGMTITGGSAGQANGGGIFSNGASLTLEAVNLVGNLARQGGAIYNQGGQIVISGGIIASNQATERGGGIASFAGTSGEPALILDRTQITLNTAPEGGGMWLGSQGLSADCARISRALISRNQANGNSNSFLSGGGGAISISLCGTTISASALFENQSTDQGGAVASVSAALTIQQSLLRANTTQEVGGAISNYSVLTPVRLLANTILDNRAAQAGGVYLFNGTVTDRFAGNIIARNTVTRLDPDLLLVNDSGDSGYNLIGIGSESYRPTTTDLVGTAAAPLDPMLAPLDEGLGTPTVFLPQPGSPALNAIPPEACIGTSDQRDLARPQGGRCEIGSAEVEPPANRAPTVSAGGPYTVDEGSDLLITATASDPDGDTLSYSWARDGEFVGRQAQLLLPGPTLFGPARIPLTVTVSDPAGLTAQATTEVVVNNVAPTARIVAPAEVTAGQAFMVELVDMRDPGADLLRFAFDCGDGQGYSPPAIGSTSRSCPTSAAGVRTVRASVEDQDGGRNEYSAQVSVAPQPAVQTGTSLTLSAASLTYGQALTLTASVQAGAAAVGEGVVAFYAGESLVAQAEVQGGQATAMITSLPVGSNPLRASYQGSAGYQTSSSETQTVSVSRAPTALSLTLASARITEGEPASLSASLTTTPTAPTAPTGALVFFAGATEIGRVSLATGSSLAINSLAPGRYRIAVRYSGDSSFEPSSSRPATLVVRRASATAVSASPETSMYGEYVTFTASVRTGGGVTPTGSVIFYAGEQRLGGRALSDGQAQLSTRGLEVGTHQITVIYQGSGAVGESVSEPLAYTVAPAPTTTTLATSRTPSAFGRTVTFRAIVRPATTAPRPVTGTVTFRDGDTVLAEVSLVNGQASYSTTSLARGVHQITATYGGGDAFTVSTSAPLSQEVR